MPLQLRAQDTFYVGTLKGVERIYQQTFLDTYTKLAFAKLYDRQTPLVAADLLNDRVIPFFDEHGVTLQRVLTDRGTEYCGGPEHHEYELYLAVENIDHTRTKVKSLQTNAMCESFFATLECELLNGRSFKNPAEARSGVFEFIEGWYNPHRRHSGLDYLSPIEYEKNYSTDACYRSPHRLVKRGSSTSEFILNLS